MKKIIIITLLLILFFSSACSSSNKTSKKKNNTSDIQISEKTVENKTVKELKKEEEDRIKAEIAAKEKAKADEIAAKKAAAESEVAKKEAARKKAEEEKKALEDINEGDKKEINALLSKIESTNKKGKLKIINAALKKHPKSEVLQYYKGLAFYENGDLTNAIISLERSLSINPKYHMPIELLFNIYLKDDAQKAEAFIANKSKMYPDEYKLLISVAKGYFELRNYDETIRLSKEIFKLNENNKTAFKLLASSYYFKGLSELSYYVILKAEDLMYEIPELYYIKGLISYKNKEYKKARDSFEEAFKLKPSFFEAGTRLAYSEYKAGTYLIDPTLKKEKFEAAKSVYEKVLNIKKTELTLLNYGLVLYELNEDKKALEYLEKAKKLNPSNYMIHYDIAIIYLTKQIEGINDIEKFKLAISFFEEYNRLLPKKDIKSKNADTLITEAKIAKSLAEAKISSAKEEEERVKQEAIKKKEAEEKAIADKKAEEEKKKQEEFNKTNDNAEDNDKAEDDDKEDDKVEVKVIKPEEDEDEK